MFSDKQKEEQKWRTAKMNNEDIWMLHGVNVKRQELTARFTLPEHMHSTPILTLCFWFL